MSKETLPATNPVEPPIKWRYLPDWIAREYGIPKPHLSTIERWRLAGRRGAQLETYFVGGRRYVKPEAVRAFIRDINTNTAA